jgi:two-component system invasion response regulator UvrY
LAIPGDCAMCRWKKENRCLLLPKHRTLNEFSILLADDHSIVRIGLSILIGKLDASIQVDEAPDIDTMIVKLTSKTFDLLILDINMRHAESFRLINRIRRDFPSVHVLIYTVNNELILATRFLRSGIQGYLLKESDEAEVLRALTAVMAGKVFISDSLARQLADQQSSDAIHPFDTLSNREFEVVLQWIKGNPTTEIAGILHLNTSTVRTHKNQIMKKLGVSNMIDLLNLARDYRLLR